MWKIVLRWIGKGIVAALSHPEVITGLLSVIEDAQTKRDTKSDPK